MKPGNYNQKKSREAILEDMADKTGLAVIVVEGEDSRVIAKSNNNSICEMLNSSVEFSPKCALFCGNAVKSATESGKPIAVKCHANLHYFAVPVTLDENRETAVIIGRTFLKADEYREATERAMTGDWQDFPSQELFKNVLLTSSTNDLEKAVKRFEKLDADAKHLLFQTVVNEPFNDEQQIEDANDEDDLMPITQAHEITKLIEKFHHNHVSETINSNPISEHNLEENEAVAAWRSLFNSLLDLSFRDASKSVLLFLSKRFNIENLAWLERKGNAFEAVLGVGSFEGQHIQIPIPADEGSLLEVLKRESSVEFRERKDVENGARQIVNLFPVAAGVSIQSALIVGDKLEDVATKRHIAKFLRNVSWELEILRLRELVERQSSTTTAIRRLNETIKKIDSEDYWTILAQISAELMQAEQSSLLLFDETTEEFLVKAAIGTRAETIRNEVPSRLGSRVAQSVLKSGKPLVIGDTVKVGLKALSDRKYKTNSFISYPIVISGRKIGVLNLADKIDGGKYTETDLELLDTLMPQIAVSLDRTSLMRKAGEFEELSITDSLTGLVNRRYLEQRLAEEVKRSQRDGYPLSFMMIDADEFKQYNDAFGHPEGDTALQIIGQCLKATLRGADVAARFGGEEFSILLPQTTLNEAYTIAERLRAKIETTRFPNRQVTVSIGVSTCSRTLCNSTDLIAAADKALYEAKKNGRNTVQIYQKKLA